MSIIKILPENLVNQIAAGEVVERPASALKELVENSLDSGADRIEVELKDGGKTFLKVSDNGCGMSLEDLEMSVQRHATSKISKEADLWQIGTMGFRGEALASIASISKFSIRSRGDGDSGYELEVNGGDKVKLNEVGMSRGTVVEIRELFFNTPARQKYLKNDSTELSRIMAAVNQVALSRPDVAIKVVHNAKTVSDLPAVTDLQARVSDIFGASTCDAMLPIFYGGTEFQIDGFIGKPLLSRSSSQHQYFFVNGRAIVDHLLANRVKAAYHSMLMEHKKPVFVINIKIDPSLVDVNVHPRKLEVRFEDQQGMVKAIYGCVKTALEKAELMPKGFSESQRYMSDGLSGERGGLKSLPSEGGGRDFGLTRKSSDKYEAGALVRNSAYVGRESVQDAMDFTKNMAMEREPKDLEEGLGMRPVMQLLNSYIVAENEAGLILIDQHAAHERVRYEELMKQFNEAEKKVQPLLVPQEVELSSDEKMMLEENMEIFVGLGFEINGSEVRAVPGCLSGDDVGEVVRGVLDDLAEGKIATEMQGDRERVLTSMSCRSAIMFGKSLQMVEMEALLRQLDKCERKYTCPHGRPTMVSLSMEELAKMFGRK